MKKTLLIALALVAICIMPSCVKDSEKDKIVFGNDRGMSVISYEGIPLVEQYGHNSWGYTIDLNGDGQHDVQFHSTSEIAEGGILTELYCKHTDIALLGDLIDQKFTLFANDAKDSFGDDGTFMSTDVKLREGDKYYFPKDETKYIGFKLTENDQSHLGWMKVILHEDEVELLETAIQK
jgi:hypothetical protein